MSKYHAMTRTGGQALVAQLIEEGVVDVFGIPGVQLDWAVDAMRERQEEIRLVVPRHEQATSYMADGYARTTGREGVCMVVPGPGMLNALSGIATAHACSSPVLFIVGQIPSHAIGRGAGLLHEIPDQSGILKSLTKWHGIATKPEEIPDLVTRAFAELRSGQILPVAIEIPPDVLEAKAEIAIRPRAERIRAIPERSEIERAAALLSAANFPVIQAGGGAMASEAGDAIRALAERLEAPVVMTDGGRGILDDAHPLALTSLGGRAVLAHADTVLVVGSRFVNALGQPTHADPDCRYIYLNANPAHLGEPRIEGVSLCGDARAGVEAILDLVPATGRPSAAERVASVRAWEQTQISAIVPQHAYVEALRAAMADDDILVSELTQIGYYANIAYPVHAPRRYITPGYQGTLGYGFNTALGAAHGNPANRVVSLNGDGGFGWGLTELSTAGRERYNISIVVFVDGKFGNVQRIQKRTFGVEFATDVPSPEFEHLGRAFGIPTESAPTPEALGNALRAAAERGGPALIVVPVGEMPSPWALIHPFVPPVTPPPPNPLG